MGKMVKITLFTALLVLVVLGAAAEQTISVLFPGLQSGLEVLDPALYLRLAGLIGLIAACFWAWGYKRKVEASHKYRRAKDTLAAAEAEAERKRAAAAGLEEKLKAEFGVKEQALKDTLESVKADHKQQLLALKEQNVQLKEAVSKLLGALKKKSV